MAALVEADAFISPSPTQSAPSTKRGHAAMPLTTAGSKSQQRMTTSWSSTALEMSGGSGEAAVSGEGTATIPDEIFNLVKSIVGAGVLSLPAGACVHELMSPHDLSLPFKNGQYRDIEPTYRGIVRRNIAHYIFYLYILSIIYRCCRVWKCTKCLNPSHNPDHRHRRHLRLYLHAHCPRLQNDWRDLLCRCLG